MSRNEKLIKRFKKQPKDFTWEEMERLLLGLGFQLDNKGKTSGSRVRFSKIDSALFVDMHKPHPKNIIKENTMKDVYNKLTINKLI